MEEANAEMQRAEVGSSGWAVEDSSAGSSDGWTFEEGCTGIIPDLHLPVAAQD